MSRFISVKTVFHRARDPRFGDGGFSLVELIFTMALVTILMTLGAFAARQFWFRRSLTGGQDQIVTQMRALQSKVVGEGSASRYRGAWFDPGSEDWGTLSYNATTAACTATGTFELDAGVEIQAADVATTAAGVDFAPVSTECKNDGAAPSVSDVGFVWFLSRGVATRTRPPDDPDEAGNHIRLQQPRLDGPPQVTIEVTELTGRVEKG